MVTFCKKLIRGVILITLFSYNIFSFAEDEKEIIGKVLNYRPLAELELNIATIHRRFLERFFDEVRYDSCYVKKLDEGKYVVAEIFYISKLNEDILEGEPYLIRKKLREARDFIIFLWQFNENSESISPANFFSRAALIFSHQSQK